MQNQIWETTQFIKIVPMTTQVNLRLSFQYFIPMDIGAFILEYFLEIYVLFCLLVIIFVFIYLFMQRKKHGNDLVAHKRSDDVEWTFAQPDNENVISHKVNVIKQ